MPSKRPHWFSFKAAIEDIRIIAVASAIQEKVDEEHRGAITKLKDQFEGLPVALASALAAAALALEAPRPKKQKNKMRLDPRGGTCTHLFYVARAQWSRWNVHPKFVMDVRSAMHYV